MRCRIRCLPAIFLGVALACRSGDPSPSELDTHNDVCRSCRMTISDRHLASQLTESGEETLFFDDLGCLREYLGKSARRPGQIAYVADHRTGDWIRASTAVFSRCASVETPMASHLIALAGAEARGEKSPCAEIPSAEIFGPAGPPDGGAR